MTAGPLHGATVAPGDTAAARHAAWLLGALGASRSASAPDLRPAPHHATAIEAWARGGGAALTGDPDGPPLGGPAPIGAAMDGAGAALQALTSAMAGQGTTWRAVNVDGASLLGERATSAGLCRRGPVAPGGACRMVQAADGWLAVNLPRAEDHELVPAWLEQPHVEGWDELAEHVRSRPAVALADRAGMLGLAVAVVARPADLPLDPQGRARSLGWPVTAWRLDQRSRPASTDAPRGDRPVRVVDLSSLWAGPLTSRLLADAGAEIVKVESTRRPDGLRTGDPRFFDRLNHGVRSVALDLRDPEGVAALQRLLRSADVVIEASRPRALDQLHCGPAELLGRDRAQVWVSITGYGRSGPWCQRPALGDDAGVAGGLAVRGEVPRFCADAIADPATGLHAALAALACLHAGGSWHVDIAMREVAASLVPDLPDGPPARPEARRSDSDEGWVLEGVPVAVPTLGHTEEHAPPLGAHTDEVLREVGA